MHIGMMDAHAFFAVAVQVGLVDVESAARVCSVGLSDRETLVCAHAMFTTESWQGTGKAL